MTSKISKPDCSIEYIIVLAKMIEATESLVLIPITFVILIDAIFFLKPLCGKKESLLFTASKQL